MSDENRIEGGDYWDDAESSWSGEDDVVSEEDSPVDDSTTSDEIEMVAEFHRTIQDGTVRLITDFAEILNYGPSRPPGPPQPVNYDISLASKHAYLGEEMEELSGRTLLDEGSILWLPLVFELGIVLVPGQTLPLCLANSVTVTLLHDVIKKDKTFGIMCLPDKPASLGHFVGTTAEIFEYKERRDGQGLNVKAKGRQRFKLLEWRQTFGRVQILPEIRLSNRLETRISSLDRYRANDSFTAKNGRVDQSGCVWPPWVYAQYDGMVLARKVTSELLSLNYIDASLKVPKDPLDLSYWLMQIIPFDNVQRTTMLKMNTAEERLKYVIEHIPKYNSTVYCRFCGIAVSSKEEMFSMSAEGPQGAYCNPGGNVHEILTVLDARLTLERQQPSTEFTWFPGYGWTIAKCARCQRHIGWLFTAMEPELTPTTFWGLTKRSVTVAAATPLLPGAIAISQFFENAHAFP